MYYRAVALAYQAINSGDNELIVAGGQENMTRANHTAYARGNKLGSLQFNDSLLKDGLTDSTLNIHMGNTAEHLAKEYKISREAQDEFALNSQRKTNEAIQNGHFIDEIVPVIEKRTGKNLDKDEFPKSNTTLETLAKLRPAFETVRLSLVISQFIV